MRINVLADSGASADDSAILDALHRELGFLPNLYTALTASEHALSRYWALRDGTGTLTPRDHCVIALVVGQVNDCLYSISEQTAHALRCGFSEPQIIDIRQGSAPFDERLDALARLVRNMAVERGYVDGALLDSFAAAGFLQPHLIEVLLAVGAMTISTYLANVSQLSIDFPRALRLDGERD